MNNCTNNGISCVKILVSYKKFHDLVDELKDWKKNVEDDTEDYFLWPLIRKGLVGVGGSALTYFYPLKSLKAMTSLSAYCHANKDLIEPTGDTARSVLGSLTSMKNKIFEFLGKKKERILNPNKGVVGDLTEFLCGTVKEYGKYVTIKKRKIY